MDIRNHSTGSLFKNKTRRLCRFLSLADFVLFVWFDSLLIFVLNRDGSSWVEPVLN